MLGGVVGRRGYAEWLGGVTKFTANEGRLAEMRVNGLR
jgi:hypothetical protein